MGFRRAGPPFLVLLLLLSSTETVLAQGEGRIWGRITTTSGDAHEGFIRWDRNEASWVDLLDGYKETESFEYRDWWELAHPGDRRRDRVVELAGYRITWDDEEPDLSTSHESGIRFGHIRRLFPGGEDQDEVLLELRSGVWVTLTGGATDLGPNLREVQVLSPDGGGVTLEWEELATVDLLPAPVSVETPGGRRIHGTVEVEDGPSFTGFIAWDVDHVLTSETLEGEDREGRTRRVPFGRILSLRPQGEGAVIRLVDGEEIELSNHPDVDDGNDGIQVSDPKLGLVDVDWDDLARVRFHEPTEPVGLEALDGGRRLRGTVMTADSTELTGWIRWDGDEEYSWELLDGYVGDVSVDIEFGQIEAIERRVEILVGITIGTSGSDVGSSRQEGARVLLRDGRVLNVDGSNDVDDGNKGIFVLPDDAGASPDDEEAEWIRVRWEDFRILRFEGVEGS